MISPCSLRMGAALSWIGNFAPSRLIKAVWLARPHDLSCGQHAADDIIPRPAGYFIDDPKHGADRLSDGFIGRPAGEVGTPPD